MIRSIVGGAMAAVVALGVTAARADEIGTEIDLTSLSEMAQEPPPAWDDIPLQDVARSLGTAPRRVYVSAMIGPSLAQFNFTEPSAYNGTDTLFAAGGALGVAFERPMGQLRVEAEGMGRGSYEDPINIPLPNVDTLLTNNWSAMANVWRDLMLTDRVGIYGAGGIGAGGYILGFNFFGSHVYTDPATASAWQAGAGMIWEVTDRVTFDFGYRYFQLGVVDQDLVDANQFGASELMFTLRFYEPFKAFRR